MIHESKRITDFVDHTVLASDDAEEVDLLHLDTAYGELARLDNVENTLSSLIDDGVDPSDSFMSNFLTNISSNTKASEETADMASGLLLESYLSKEEGSKPAEFVGCNIEKLKGMDPLAQAGSFLGLSESNSIMEGLVKVIDKRKSQINPMVATQAMGQDSFISSIKNPLKLKSMKSIIASDKQSSEISNTLSGVQEDVSLTEPEGNPSQNNNPFTSGSNPLDSISNFISGRSE